MTGFYENYDDAEGVHKGSAEQSALEAAASATAAASSATSAETSATSSSTKAGEAATSASTATTKASEAATSASTATTKASESATSASASDTSATESATSATASESSRQASASAAAVAVSAYGSAFNSATASAASATAAAGSESAVAASATAAAGSATTASTSASNAATSESNAATSATEAAASATLANSAEVVTVAGIAADVTAVAGIDGNVTSVAGIASDVTTVAAEPLKTNIATVAATPLSTNINIVGPAASSVTTVAGDIAKVNTVAADLSGSDTIGTVAGVASNVTTVSGIAADVTTVAGITAGDISLVAAIDDKVTQVAAINDQVAVVGSDPYKTKVETVAESVYKGKVETVSGLTSEVTSVANIASDVTTVSANITDIQNAEQNANTATTKAAESAASAVTSAASASTSASSAAASASSATAAASSESNAATSESDAAVSASSATVSAASAQSSKEAAAVSETNAAASYDSFDDRYLGVKSSAPSTDNDGGALLTGALYFNSTNNTMNVFTGSAWAPVANNNIINPNVALTQDLATNGNDIKFGDNDKAVFGAGDDLQIYHNGNNSFIADTGTGSLYIRAADSLRLQSYGTNADMIRAESEGAVSLFYDKATYSAAKLATTSTGIDVTGAATMDGLTVEGNGALFTLDNGSNAATLSNTNGNVVLNYDAADAGRAFTVQQNGRNALRVNNSGDVSFYEDTGTTAKLFWDASAESLGIGTSSPAATLHVDASSPEFRLAQSGTAKVRFRTSGDNYINTGHNLGIGTSSPSQELHVVSSGTAATRIQGAGSANYLDVFHSASSFGLWGTGGQFLQLVTNNTERMRITSSGRVGIGTSNPSVPLHVIGDIATNTRVAADTINGYTGGSTPLTIQTGGAQNVILGTNNTERMRISSAGNVGIGTTSPDAALEVNSGGGIHLSDHAVGRTLIIKPSLTGSIHEFTSDNTSAGYSFSNNSSELMRIDNAGRVGIGTSSPSADLHVAGNGRFDNSASTPVRLHINNSGSNDYASIYADTATAYKNLVLNPSGGNVGIGTSSPSAQVHLSKAGGTLIKLGTSQNTSEIEVREVGAANNLVFSSNNSVDHLVIDDAGRVGIGTSSPSSKLHIVGSTSSERTLIIEDTFGNDVQIQASVSGGNASMVFKTEDAERMRIDSSGNWMLGTTNSNVYTSSTENGLYVTSTGQIRNSVGAVAAYLNRTGSDGTIAEFRKDGTTVGSIGNATGTLVVGSPDGSGSYLRFGSNNINPTTSAGALRDAAIDLGKTGGRFKDLHLSGTAYAGVLNLKDGNTNGQINCLTPTGGKLYTNTYAEQISQIQGSEKMRLDSSGNLLVGTTNTAVYTTSNQTGLVYRADFGLLGVSRQNNYSGSFNRYGNDGNILNFRKDGTTVGSIGVKDGYLTAGNADAGLLFLGSGVKRIQPWSVSSNSGADNQIDLGYSTERFKDLYLSGTIHKSTGTGTFKVETSGSSSVNLEASNTLKFTVGDSDSHQFINGSSEVARMDSLGNLLVGTTDTTIYNHTTGEGVVIGPNAIQISRSSDQMLLLNRMTNSGPVAGFYAAGVGVGSIAVTGSATSYLTSSDQRLKENIADADDAGSKIDAIQVRKYDWKADGSHQDYGMIAQELVEVAPEAVTVPEDSEEMMGVDYSKLVPMLIKEIQSLRNRVAQLETGE